MKIKLLIESIDNLISLLREANSSYWVSTLEEIIDKLLNNKQRVNALNELESLFGGMGTLNDLVFCEANNNLPQNQDEDKFNAKYNQLLNKIFKEMRLVNSGFFARAYWVYLEFKHQGDLPPRIKKSFR